MLDLIVQYSNSEAENQIHNSTVGDQICARWFPICTAEVRAFIGILFLQGVLRGCKQQLRDFWDNRFGQPTVIATMSVMRFMHILKFMRFDDRATRPERAINDKLAPVRELWSLFVRNCK